MNKGVMWRTAIIGLFFSLFLVDAQAQDVDTLYIYGSEYLCEFDCGSWGVEESNPSGGEYIWTFTGDNGFVTQLTSETPFIDFCDLPGGYYLLEVNSYFQGELTGTGAYEVYVEFSNAFIFGQIDLQNDCGTDTLFFDQGTSGTNCYDFCLGETYTLYFYLQVLSNNGSTGEIVNWSNTGGVITATGGNSGSAAFFFTETGEQYITIEGTAFNQCDSYTTSRICANVHAAPDPTFTTQPPAVDGILSVCDGQTIAFENTTPEADNFFWDFGDGNFSSEENPSHTYTQAGTYTVTFRAGGGCNCMGETSMTIIVTDNDSPLVDCVGTVCAGETVTYTSQSVCGTYNWTVGPEGMIIAGGGTADDFVTVAWTSGPVGVIGLEVADCPNLSACTVAAQIQVPVVDDNASIEGPTQPCLGEVSVYEITAFAGTSYQWSVSSFGTILSGQGTPSIQVQWFEDFLPAVAQSVSVTYDNCYLGCGGSDELVVNIRAGYFVEGPIEVCNNGNGVYAAINDINNNTLVAHWEVVDANGNSVYLTPAATTAASIDWTFGPGTYDLIARPDDPTQYCAAEQSYQVTVLPPPPPINNVAGQLSICAGSSYAYEVIDSDPAERYRWTVTQGGSTTERLGNPIVVQWDQGGPYGLEVVRIQHPPLNCESDPTVLNIAPFATFAIAGDADACFDQLATYSTDAVGAFSYSWQITPASAGTITGADDAATVDILWHSVGAATVRLDICGQQEIYPVTVHPIPVPVVNAPAELCPNETAMVSTVLNYDAYSWQDTVGNVVSTQAAPMLGAGYYRLEVTDAFGCTGSTHFYIYGHPAAEINISTPDATIFCNTSPAATLYATATTDAFSYQWLRDGNPVGTDNPVFQATQTGTYRVQVTDVNACVFVSNNINIIVDCGPGGGGGGGDDCTGATIDFIITPTPECNRRVYVAGGNYIPGSVTWTFSGPTQTSTAAGNNVTPVFSEPGFYDIIIAGVFDDGMGGTWNCFNFKKDTIKMAADFDYVGACAGEVIEFFDLSTFLSLTSITDWSWDFGDPGSGADNTSSAKDPMHTYTTEGEYTVRLTVTATDGCTSTLERILSVYPQPDVSFSEPIVNCEGTALEFTADVAATVNEVSWDFGDPASGQANGSSLFQTYHAYENPGNYTVTLNVSSIYGCTNSFSRTITVSQNTLAGTIDPPGSSDICEGDSITLTSPGGGDSYLWSTGETSSSVSVSEAGVYQLTVTDSNGCTYSPDPVVVNIIPAPVAPIRAALKDDNGQTIAYESDSLTSCFGEDVYLETVDQAGYSYSWSTGGTQYNTEYSEDRNNILSVGEHNIELTVTENSTGCQLISTFRIIVLPVPDAFGIVGDVAAACAGTTVTLSIDNPQTGIEYRWNNGSTGSTIMVSAAGDYTAVAVSPAGCTTETDAVYTIAAGADVRLVPDGCHRRCGPDTLCVPMIPDAVAYQWYYEGNPVAGPNGTNPNLIADNSGSYSLEITDVNGCVTNSPPLTLDLFDGFGDITGEVYFDVDMDGMISAADTVVPDIGLYYLNLTQTDTDSTLTNSLGNYVFTGIPEAMYRLGVLAASLPDNWSAYTPSVDTTLEGCGTQLTIDWLLFLDCPNQTATESFTICEGEVLNYRGENYSSDTTFIFQTGMVNACDSTITFQLDVLAVDAGAIQLQTCPGGTVTYAGQQLAEGSITDFVLQNALGCDSTVTVQVQAYPPSAPGMVQLQACAGGTATYAGQQLAEGSSTDFVLQNALGCDSTVTVQVQAYPPSAPGMVQLQACAGGTATYAGQQLAEGSSTDFVLQNALGCDSTVTVQVQAYPPSAPGMLQLQTCDNQPVTYAGQELAVGSSTDFVLQNALGCDSTVTVQVQAYTIDQTAAVLTAVCAGETFLYAGQQWPVGTNESIMLSSVQGCDSAVLLTVLEVEPPVFSLNSDPSCADFGTGSVQVTVDQGQITGYQLDNGPNQSTGQFVDVTAGTHEVTVSYANVSGVGTLFCSETSILNVDELPSLAVNSTAQELDCSVRSLDISVDVLSGDDGTLQYLWADGSTTESITVSEAGAYMLTISNACEDLETSVAVTASTDMDALAAIYMPNAFSPNGDGVNDFFEPYSAAGTGIIEGELFIFDRWGGLVCREAGDLVRWNGETGNSQARSGVYIWRLIATVDNCGTIEEVQLSGDVMLIR